MPESNGSKGNEDINGSKNEDAGMLRALLDVREQRVRALQVFLAIHITCLAYIIHVKTIQ